jgi:DNA-directed RNA polymerase subunit beta
METSTLLNRRRKRRSFGKIYEAVSMPNLIEVQRHSYEQYLQMYTNPEDRIDEGLQEVFKSIFPIDDFSGKSRLEFVSYNLEPPKYDVEECQQRDLTFASGLRVTLRLIVWDIDEESGTKSVRDMKEQDVYLGEMPLMTPNGTFVVNGVERVIVSQMHRSPGVFFDHDKGKTHASGKFLLLQELFPIEDHGLTLNLIQKT